MKKIILLFILLFTGLFLFAENSEYEIFTAKGILKKLNYYGITTYKVNSKGYPVYVKWPYGLEEWVEYDSKGNVLSIKDSKSTDFFRYDKKGNLIYIKSNSGKYEAWFEYDSDGNLVSTNRKTFDGFEEFQKLNKAGQRIYSKNSDGYEEWYEYAATGERIYYRSLNSDGDETIIKSDINGNLIYTKTWNSEYWYDYNSEGKRIHMKNSYGKEEWYEYDSEGNTIIIESPEENKEVDFEIL